MLRAGLASFHAEGTMAIEGPDRVKLNWRADAVRGQWARVAMSSSLATDPLVEVRARAGDGLFVRVTPPGAPPTLYRAQNDLSHLPVDDPIRAAAEWLNQVARDERSAMPPLSSIRLNDDVVRIELAREGAPRTMSHDGALGVALRRSDGMPIEIEASLRGDPARMCLLARPRGDRALAITGTPLSLVAGVDATLQACCNRQALASVRLTIARLRNDAPGPLPHWSETAQPIEALRDNRWMRRTFRDAEAVRDAAMRACKAPSGVRDR
jgi:hypothetical protein